MNYHILVNKKNMLPEDYFEHIELSKTQDIEGENIFCEKETLKHFRKLQKYVKENVGVDIGIDSAFRTGTRQRQLYKEFVEKYGKEFADEIVAPPGHSEHETGLAIDLGMHLEDKSLLENDDDLTDYKDVFEKFVHPILKDFGFILRYPKDKKQVTGYPYEPWHIRYVGVEFTKKYKDDVDTLTLEEIYEKYDLK